MNIIKSATELMQARAQMRGKIAFVPTMGALHDGHLSLGRLARTDAEIVVYSIFVNPTQFGAGEDLSRYPRDVAGDLAKLAGIADYVYLPSEADIYPEGYVLRKAGEAAQGLCGASRPTHFDGVVTVVGILFEQVQPHFAIFGEKDFQQLQVIREMNFAPTIIGAPIAREADGLAMSSRNIYLSPEERKIAPKLYEIISEIAKKSHPALDTRSKNETPHQVRGVEELGSVGFRVDYVEQRWNRILVAVWLGKTRLIDNVLISVCK